MFASISARRVSVITVAGLVGLLAVAGPVFAMVSSSQDAQAPAPSVAIAPTLVSSEAPATSNHNVATPVLFATASAPEALESAPVAEATTPSRPAAAAAAEAVAANPALVAEVVSASSSASGHAESAASDVEIGTACVIEAEGTASGC